MEPVGLAVGIVGLAGLFSTCLEVLNTVDTFRDFGTDSDRLTAQFVAYKLRFEKWGKAIGVQQGRISDDHHKALDDPQTRLTIESLLSTFKYLITANDASQAPAIGSTVKYARHGFSTAPPQKGFRSRLKWALGDKAKCMAQVEQFGKLVQVLHDLVPLDGVKDTTAKKRRTLANGYLDNGAPSDTGTWIAEFQRMCARIKELEAENRREISEWLLGKDQSDELSLPERLKGTCDWILDRPAFRSWVSPDFLAGSAKLLWIHGPAGFGKTILCNRIVEHLPSEIQAPVAHVAHSRYKYIAKRDTSVDVRTGKKLSKMMCL